jgi:hypothetical protein
MLHFDDQKRPTTEADEREQIQRIVSGNGVPQGRFLTMHGTSAQALIAPKVPEMQNVILHIM